MTKVSGRKGSSGPVSSSAPQPTGPVQTTPVSKAPPSDDSISEAAKGLIGYKSSPLVSGAMKIFGDNVILPAHLTDANNPRNDPKYLRLLSAVLGLDELERYFHTLEDKQQEEYLAYKTEQRERKWAEAEREKEEKKRLKEEHSEEKT